jgi:uracil-DNA glycosylase
LIGEAPSAHGARFSGIAFTAERSLSPAQRTSAIGLKPDGFTEQSATILRHALERLEIDPGDLVLWNVVPFHPSDIADPLRNRTPVPNEIALGSRWLRRFLQLMQPRRIAAVGQTAACVVPAGTVVLRHPAHGGSRQLKTDLVALAADVRAERGD